MKPVGVQALNGQNVYNGCCALHIDFSKLKHLSVRYNNDKSRDFTNPQLGTDDPGSGADPGRGHPMAPPPPPPGHVPGAGVWGPYPGHGFNMESGFGFYHGKFSSSVLCALVISVITRALRENRLPTEAAVTLTLT